MPDRATKAPDGDNITGDIITRVSDAAKLFDQMRRNSRDWRIEDLRVVADRFGVTIRQGRGSHVKFCHPAVRRIVIVPARRPIKEVYVRQLVKLIDEALTKP